MHIISESVNMGICSGNNECIILCKVNPNRSTLISTQVGSVEPLHVAALGKVFMSEWPTKQIVDYFDTIRTKKVTQKSIDNAEQMISECLETRRRGYAIDDEENLDGIRCVAMPVRDYTEKIVASISVSARQAGCRWTASKRSWKNLHLPAENSQFVWGIGANHDERSQI